MAKSRSTRAASESRLFVLALGLLVGFVIAFVLLLSRLPVDGIISQQSGYANGQRGRIVSDDQSRRNAQGESQNREAEVAEINFDYYSVLQAQQAARKTEPQSIAVEPPVVFMEPPSNTVPAGETATRAPDSEQPGTRSQITPVQVAPEQVTSPAPAQVVSSAPEPVVPPAPRQVESSAAEQLASVRPRVRQAVPIREIPASRSGQDAYYVEAGNYQANEEALQAQIVLRSLGFEAFIVVRQNNNGAFGHRVRIGPFFEQSRLDATRTTLRDSGINPKLIRVKS